MPTLDEHFVNLQMVFSKLYKTWLKSIIVDTRDYPKILKVKVIRIRYMITCDTLVHAP